MPCYSSCDILGDTSLSPIEVRVLLISFPPDPAFGQRVNAEDPVSKAQLDVNHIVMPFQEESRRVVVMMSHWVEVVGAWNCWIFDICPNDPSFRSAAFGHQQQQQKHGIDPDV